MNIYKLSYHYHWTSATKVKKNQGATCQNNMLSNAMRENFCWAAYNILFTYTEFYYKDGALKLVIFLYIVRNLLCK